MYISDNFLVIATCNQLKEKNDILILLSIICIFTLHFDVFKEIIKNLEKIKHINICSISSIKNRTQNIFRQKTQILTAYDSGVFLSTTDFDHRIISNEKVTRDVVRKTAFAVCENSSGFWNPNTQSNSYDNVNCKFLYGHDK